MIGGLETFREFHVHLSASCPSLAGLLIPDVAVEVILVSCVASPLFDLVVHGLSWYVPCRVGGSL